MDPLSDERPKALVPTLGLPQLDWALAGLRAIGVRRAWVNVRGEAGTIRAEAERVGALLDMEVRLSLEPEQPLGTSGALGKLAGELDETFVVVNADVACDLALGLLVEAHHSARGPATLVGIPTPNRADFVTEHGWVVELVDRHRRVGAGHVYAGIGIFEPSVLRYVPPGVSHLFDTVMCGLMRDGLGLALLEWTGYWSDIPDPPTHLRVNLEALAGALPALPVTAALHGAPERWDRLAYVGEGARAERADLHHAVVGAGADVAAGARLERCVVWDGAVVPEGVYEDVVITPRQVVAAAGEATPDKGRLGRAR
jgi:NDP-sugar pyrophosphorylase family protein